MSKYEDAFFFQIDLQSQYSFQQGNDQVTITLNNYGPDIAKVIYE